MCDWRKYLCKRGVCGLSFCGLCDDSVQKGNMFKHIIILKELDIQCINRDVNLCCVVRNELGADKLYVVVYYKEAYCML